MGERGAELVRNQRMRLRFTTRWAAQQSMTVAVTTIEV